jgi:hypothetical protein
MINYPSARIRAFLPRLIPRGVYNGDALVVNATRGERTKGDLDIVVEAIDGVTLVRRRRDTVLVRIDEVVSDSLGADSKRKVASI